MKATIQDPGCRCVSVDSLTPPPRIRDPKKTPRHRPPCFSCYTPGQGFFPRGHGNLCDQKIVGVFASLI